MSTRSSIEEPVVRGIALTEKEVKITIADVPDKPGMAAMMFDELSRVNANIDMIVQSVSHDRHTDISFTVEKGDLRKAYDTAKDVAKRIGARDVLCDEDIAKVSIVGIGMRSHSGVASTCFSVLAKNKINIEMISTSEISISCVIKKQYGKDALKALHAAFGLDRKKRG